MSEHEPNLDEIIGGLEFAEVGLVITPGEMGDRIQALNASILALDASVQATPFNSEGFNAGWRGEWDAFVRRWAAERDSFASWDSRLFSYRVMPIVEDFTASYQRWARDFQKKSGKAPLVPNMREQSNLVPSWAWLAMVAAGAAVVWSYRKK